MIVLASASPRRREILTTLGIEHEVRPSGADETRDGDEPARDYAVRVASAKAAEIAASCEPGRFVLAADTVVVVDGEILGKPESDAAARGMLRMLAGRWHEVITGVALARGGQGVIDTLAVTTRVAFRPLDVATVERYVASGEGRDKAGAYGAQGLASGFVRGIEGSYWNVVGLPASETIELLEKHGAITGWPR